LIEQKFAKKGRFKFIDTWVFPKEVDEFIKETMHRFRIQNKDLCHVFCGKSQIGGLRVDADPELHPDLVADCITLPDKLGTESQGHVLADFPWQIGYHQRRYFSYALRDICKTNGYLILNAPWNPWVTGLKLVEVWKVTQAFNSYRDLVDFWIFRKMSAEEIEEEKKLRKKRKTQMHRVIVHGLDADEAERISEYLKNNSLDLDLESVTNTEKYEVRE